MTSLLKKLWQPEIAAVLTAAVIMLRIVLPTPIVGVADNGDFARIMGPAGLDYLSPAFDDRFFNHVSREFSISQPVVQAGEYFSTEIVLVRCARLINILIQPDNRVFDIRFLAGLYVMLALTAIYAIIRAIRASCSPFVSWTTAGLLIFIFSDIGYVAYFNSLYGEALSLVALLLTIGFGLLLAFRQAPKLSLLLAFFLAAVLLTGAKAQNAPVGLLICLLVWHLLSVRRDTVWRGAVIAMTLVLAAASVLSYAAIPDSIKIINKYQTVFYGVLKDSPDPAADLGELGLPPHLSELAGTNYFMSEYPLDIKDPAFSALIEQRINPAAIAWFYMKHPARFLDKLQAGAAAAFSHQASFISREKDDWSFTSDNSERPLGLWSRLKEAVLPRSLLFIGLFFAAFFLAICFYYQRSSNRLTLDMLVLLGLIALANFAIPLIGDGEADLSKHLFLFNAGFDLMLLSAAAWIVHIGEVTLRTTFCQSKP